MKNKQQTTSLLVRLCELFGIPVPASTEISPDQMPQPYKELLVHERDMTGRLERFYEKPVHLQTLKIIREGERLYRQVLLKTPENQVVEFGAIEIHLAMFEGEARKRVLDCYQPLGGILNEFGVSHRSELGGFLKIASDAFIERTLKLTEPRRLYGRQNRLIGENNAVIAEVVEILPPADSNTLV